MERAAKLKLCWVGHIARKSQDEWLNTIIYCRTTLTKRSVGRPQKEFLNYVATQNTR